MNNINRVLKSSLGKDLERVVEPLANFICASERPQADLASALAVLVREVEATNRAAATHFHSHLMN